MGFTGEVRRHSGNCRLGGLDGLLEKIGHNLPDNRLAEPGFLVGLDY